MLPGLSNYIEGHLTSTVVRVSSVGRKVNNAVGQFAIGLEYKNRQV